MGWQLGQLGKKALPHKGREFSGVTSVLSVELGQGGDNRLAGRLGLRQDAIRARSREVPQKEPARDNATQRNGCQSPEKAPTRNRDRPLHRLPQATWPFALD